MLDPISESFCTSFKNPIIDQSDPDTVTRKLDQYISQACKRIFEQNKYKNKRNKNALYGMMQNVEISGLSPLKLVSESLMRLRKDSKIWHVASIGLVKSEKKGVSIGNV